MNEKMYALKKWCPRNLSPPPIIWALPEESILSCSNHLLFRQSRSTQKEHYKFVNTQQEASNDQY